VAVEGAAQDQPERSQAGVHVPAPAEGRQAEVGQRVEAPVGGVAHLVRRDLRVDEDRLAQPGRGREQVVVSGVIQGAGARSPEDHRVEGDAFVALPSRQAVKRVVDAGTVPVLLDRDDLHRDVPPGSGVRARSAAPSADGLAPDPAQPHSSLVEQTIHVSLNNGRVSL